MESVEKFVEACLLSQVKEARRMIAEGVDVNGVDKLFAQNGLMNAMEMSTDNKLTKILLDCNNIKLDIKNLHGETALHIACKNNNIEGVKLFLEHPACNKNIAEMKNDLGE